MFLITFSKATSPIWIIFLALSLSFNISKSSSIQVDSLLAALDTVQISIRKVEILNQLSSHIRSYDFEKAIGFAQEARNLAKEIGSPLGEADACYHLGNVENMRGNYEKSSEYYSLAELILSKTNDLDRQTKVNINHASALERMGKFDLAKAKYSQAITQSKNIELQARAFNNLGILYVHNEQLDSGGLAFRSAFNLYEQRKDTSGIAKSLDYMSWVAQLNEDFAVSIGLLHQVITLREYDTLIYQYDLLTDYGNMASLYSMIGDHDNAIKFNLKGLSILEGASRMEQKLSIYIGIGISFSNLGDHEEAILWYRKAIDSAQSPQNSLSRGYAHYDLAVSYEELEQIDSASVHYAKSILLLSPDEQIRYYTGALNGLGRVDFLRSEYDSAEAKFLRALYLSDSLGYSEGKGMAHLRLGMLFAEKVQYEEALQNLDSAIFWLGSINFLVQEAKAWEVLSDVYAEMGETQKSLDSYKHYKILSDSIVQRDRILAMERAMAELKLQRHLEEKAAFEGQIKNSKAIISLLTWSSLVLLIGAIYIFLHLKRARRKKEQILEEAASLKINLAAKEKELKELPYEQHKAMDFPFEQVEFLKSSGKFTIPHFIDRGQAQLPSEIITKGLGKTILNTPRGMFFRVHNSYAINLSHLKKESRKGSKYFAVMQSGTQVPVGEKYLKEFQAMLRKMGKK